MGWFSDDHQESYDQFDNHKASFTHELLVGGATYEAAKLYEEHEKANGKPVDHATAKALLAGFVGAATDRLVETKGLDYLDSWKAKEQAQARLENTLADQYRNDY